MFFYGKIACKLIEQYYSGRSVFNSAKIIYFVLTGNKDIITTPDSIIIILILPASNIYVFVFGWFGL